MPRSGQVVLAPILIALAAIGAFLVTVNFAITPPQAGSKTIVGWRTYTNREFGFRIQYPPTLRAVVQKSSDPLSLRFEPLVQTGPIAAGVDELTLAVSNQPLTEYRATNGLIGDYQSLTVAGRTGFRSAPLQGIEGIIENILLDLSGKTLILNASGQRRELFDKMVSSFRYLRSPANTACQDDIKICPDGTTVGRILPICEFAACPATKTTNVNESTPANVNAEGGDCRPTGCSGQVCSDQDVVTTCEFREEYACYQTATCERQSDGECGWTITETLQTCLNSATSNTGAS